MKNILKVGLLVLLVVLVTGCTSDDGSNGNTDTAEKDDKIVIAGIYKAGDQVWFIDEGEAAKAKALEMGADEFIYIDATMDPDTYLQAIDNVIAQNVDGVVTCISDQLLSQTTVSKLEEAGIPVVAADDPLIDQNGNLLSPWVGIDGYNIGYANGEFMSDYISENNLLEDPEFGVLIMTMDTVSSVIPRTDGMTDALMKDLGMTKDDLFYADYNGETAKGFDSASAIFTANPQITKWVISAGNEEGAVGAVRALEQAGIDKTSIAIGLGGYLAKDEFEKDYSAMKAATYFSSQAVGETSVEILMNYIINGTEMTEKTAVPAIIVTPDNYKEVMGL